MIVESNQHLDDVAQKLNFYLAELHLWCRKTETSSYLFIEIFEFWQNWEIMRVTHAIDPSGISSAESFKSLWESPTHQVVDRRQYSVQKTERHLLRRAALASLDEFISKKNI